jgi:hypothetical protein
MHNGLIAILAMPSRIIVKLEKRYNDERRFLFP